MTMTAVTPELHGASELFLEDSAARPTVGAADLHVADRMQLTSRTTSGRCGRGGGRWWSEVLTCTIATLLSLTNGITTAIPSNVFLDLAREDSPHQLTTFQQSVFAALASAGAAVGGLAGGWTADQWGRKCALIFTGVPVLVGYLLISYAHFSSENFFFILYLGRLLTGVAAGSSSAVISVYVTEVSLPKLRGLLGTINECLFVGGITLNYALGAIDSFRYYYISMVAVGIVALFEVLMIWLPETPRSLLSRGYVKEAERALKWLRGPNSSSVTRELEEIKRSIIAARRSCKGKMWKKVFRRSALVPLLYVVIVFLVKQFCGFNAIVAYVGEIFVDAGVSNPHSTAIYTVGAASLVGILVVFLTVDIVGRKILLAASGILMMVGSALLGMHFYITRPSLCGISSDMEPPSNDVLICNAHFAQLAVVSLTVYTFGFSVGFGPLGWVLVSELLPLSVRGKATGVCLVISFLSSTVVVGTYLEFAELFNPWLVLWTYGLVSLAGSVFVLIFVPETRGKSLEEVERAFDGGLVPLCSV